MTNKDWENFIDTYDPNKDYGSEMFRVLDNTPALLLAIDTQQPTHNPIQDLPWYITKKHLTQIMKASGTRIANYHNLSRDIVKKLPDMIAHPAIVMKSISPNNKNNDRFCIVSTARDPETDNPVIVAFIDDGFISIASKKVMKANVIASFYGKDNFYYWLKKNITKNSLLFVDERKIRNIFLPGLQLSSHNVYSFNNMLCNLGENVNCKSQILKDYDLNQIKKADIVVSALNKALEKNKEEYADYYDNNKNIISEIGFGYRKEDPSTIYHIVGDDLVENYSSVNKIYNRIQKEGINKLILREYLDYDEKESDISKIELAARLVKFNKDYDYYNFVDYAETGETINETIDRFIIETKVQMDKDHGESIKESLKNIIIAEEENKELPENNYFYLEAIQLIKNINTIYPEKTEVNQNEGKGGK